MTCFTLESRTAAVAGVLGLCLAGLAAPAADAAVLSARTTNLFANGGGTVEVETNTTAVPSGFESASATVTNRGVTTEQSADARESNARVEAITGGFAFSVADGDAMATVVNAQPVPSTGLFADAAYDLDVFFEVAPGFTGSLDLTGGIFLSSNVLSGAAAAQTARLSSFAWELVGTGGTISSDSGSFTGFDGTPGRVTPTSDLATAVTLAAGDYRLSVQLDAGVRGTGADASQSTSFSSTSAARLDDLRLQVTSVPVPEPAGLGVLVLGAAAAGRRRR